MFLGALQKAAHAAAKTPPHQSKLLHWLIGMGGFGLFIVAFFDSSPIPLPIPGSSDFMLLFLVAHRGMWVLFAGITIAGAILGGFATYHVGLKGGEAILERFAPKRYVDKIRGWVENHPYLAIGIPAILPPPVPLTPFLLAAGALHVKRRTFLISYGAFRSARYLIVAWLGHVYGRRLIHWFRAYLGEYSDTITWVIVGLFVVALAYGTWKFRRAMAGQRTPLEEPVQSAA